MTLPQQIALHQNTMNTIMANQTTMLKNIRTNNIEIKAILQHLTEQVDQLHRKLDLQLLPFSPASPTLPPAAAASYASPSAAIVAAPLVTSSVMNSTVVAPPSPKSSNQHLQPNQAVLQIGDSDLNSEKSQPSDNSETISQPSKPFSIEMLDPKATTILVYSKSARVYAGFIAHMGPPFNLKAWSSHDHTLDVSYKKERKSALGNGRNLFEKMIKPAKLSLQHAKYESKSYTVSMFYIDGQLNCTLIFGQKNVFIFDPGGGLPMGQFAPMETIRGALYLNDKMLQLGFNSAGGQCIVSKVNNSSSPIGSLLYGHCIKIKSGENYIFDPGGKFRWKSVFAVRIIQGDAQQILKLHLNSNSTVPTPPPQTYDLEDKVDLEEMGSDTHSTALALPLIQDPAEGSWTDGKGCKRQDNDGICLYFLLLLFVISVLLFYKLVTNEWLHVAT